MPTLLSLRGIEKSYPRSSDPRARLRAWLRLLAARPIERVPVLEGVSLEIRRGESLGIVGENGAGKSTLLKLISGVLTATRGQIERNGSIGALLELGAGFDLERSGRENIHIATGLMGWTTARTRKHLAEIVAFADIGHYLNEPVKHYSSGMVVRLGFAVIAAVRPDLLITDEVLAVGDESFQKKCIRWMEDYLDRGGTLLLVSHSMYHVQKLCKHALWLRQGRVEAYGDVFDVTQDYLAYHERKSLKESGPEFEANYSGAEYRITQVRVLDSEEAAPRTLSPGDKFEIEVVIYSPDARAPQLGLGLLRADGTPVYGTTSEIDGAASHQIDRHHWAFRCCFDALPLLPGGYTLKLHAMDPEGVRLFDMVERGFVLRGASREWGQVRLPHRWLVPEKAQE